MAEVIRMPRMSDTMTEGVIVEWHKKVGDKIKPGDLLAEVETDKATMELESYWDGTLLFIGVEKGKSVPVDGVMAVIGKDGEDYKTVLDQSKSAAPVPDKKNESAEPPKNQSGEEKGKEKGAVAAEPVTMQAETETKVEKDENGRIKASPLAKKLAQEKGIDISKVNGSGDGGRIVKKDIDTFVPATGSAPKEAAKPGAQKSVMPFAQTGQESFTDVQLTQMRKTIARRLSESNFTAPHFFLTMEINMDNAIVSRNGINDISPVKISFNDLVIKACAMALRQHPAVNASWMGDFIRQNNHIHIGSAIALPEGLIVPVIRFADQKSLSQIAADAKDLYDKARNKKIQPQDFTGNTFTVSNLGMMEIEEFTAIINPPDSAILAVGRIKETVIKKGDGFAVSNVMKVTLSCDHRSVDGAVGAAFLQTVKRFLENPVTMLV
ncbi:MAG: pyruvate dehydrogenase complex dihydrolipoamide acetyltransferase [Ginsengibacter sp.]